MRGKSATCRRRTSFSFESSTRHGQRPFRLMDHVSASPRLAAHQSGRAIAAAASKFDRSPRGVKYVATVSTFDGETVETVTVISSAFLITALKRGANETDVDD